MANFLYRKFRRYQNWHETSREVSWKLPEKVSWKLPEKVSLETFYLWPTRGYAGHFSCRVQTVSRKLIIVKIVLFFLIKSGNYCQNFYIPRKFPRCQIWHETSREVSWKLPEKVSLKLPEKVSLDVSVSVHPGCTDDVIQ